MHLVVLGAVLWDVFDDGKLIGGAPFNVAAHAARLGIRTTFISAVGDDELGREALQQAARLGLATEHIRTVTDAPTGAVRVFLKDGQPDYDIIRPAAYDYPALSDADVQRLAGTNPDWLYFGTLEPMNPTVLDLLRRLLAAMPDAGRFYDVNLRKESYTPGLIEQLLAETSALKLNDEEVAALARMFGISGVRGEDLCAALADRFGLECVCITRGENGCAIRRDDRFVESPGYDIRVADAVGAGDAFCAALMHGLTMKWDLRRVADFANRLGALVASKRGAVPPWTHREVDRLRTEGKAGGTTDENTRQREDADAQGR